MSKDRRGGLFILYSVDSIYTIQIHILFRWGFFFHQDYRPVSSVSTTSSVPESV